MSKYERDWHFWVAFMVGLFFGLLVAAIILRCFL
nr:MAG TPA: transmemb Cytochrome C oxidase subunit II, transmembrane [Caudoviricetes sp.]